MENLKYWDRRKDSRSRNHPIYEHRLGVMRKTMPLPELLVSPEWFVSEEVQGKEYVNILIWWAILKQLDSGSCSTLQRWGVDNGDLNILLNPKMKTLDSFPDRPAEAKRCGDIWGGRPSRPFHMPSNLWIRASHKFGKLDCSIRKIYGRTSELFIEFRGDKERFREIREGWFLFRRIHSVDKTVGFNQGIEINIFPEAALR